MKRVLAVALLAVVLGGMLAYSQWVQPPLRVSGFIESDEIRLGSRVGGRVAKVHVEEGTAVKRGDPLVELEPFDLLERLAQAQAEQTARQADYELLVAGFRDEEKAQAQAKLDGLTAHLEKLENGPRPQEIAAAQARLRQANAQLELAQMQHTRAKTLFEKNTITRDVMDTYETELKVAVETAHVREEELNELLEGTRKEDKAEAKAQQEEARQALLLRQNGSRAEEIAAAAAALAAAKAAVKVIETQLTELTIRAPVDGTVEAIELQPGDLVGAGAPVISLADTGRLWVRAYVPENRVAMQVGDKVTISVDSFGDERFEGHVSFIARQAEFTPSNVQTPEERSKQVFRIKVLLDEGLERLRPGMAAEVHLREMSKAQ
jgi:HlyD family secretion protein